MFSIPSLVKKCPDCDQQFATKTTLNIHRLKVHVAGLQNLPCPQCGQEAADLTSHMRRHHKVEGIVCPHCANIFSKKCTLNRHIEQVCAKKREILDSDDYATVWPSERFCAKSLPLTSTS